MGEVLAMQMYGPEFRSPGPTQKLGGYGSLPIILEHRKQRQEIVRASWLARLGKRVISRLSERFYLNFPGGVNMCVLKSILHKKDTQSQCWASAHRLTCTHTTHTQNSHIYMYIKHAHIHTHIHIHKYTYIHVYIHRRTLIHTCAHSIHIHMYVKNKIKIKR